MEKSKWGVHITHCCLSHGCKYGYEDCPVVSGEAVQQYICEQCDETGIKTVEEMTRQVKLEQPGQIKIEISAEPDKKMAEQGTPYSWCVLKYREPDSWNYSEWKVVSSGWSTSIDEAYKAAVSVINKINENQ